MDKLFGTTIVETDGVRAIAGGGTGASTATQARTNLGITHVSGNGTNAIQPRLGGNAAIGSHSVVSGGSQSVANGNYSVIAGGDGNSTSNTGSVVSGGIGNSAANAYSTVGGGDQNTTIADYAVVGGGQKNSARGVHSLVVGGLNNLALSNTSAIGGGVNNVAAQKVRRANNITSSTNTITVLSATAADFDNTGLNALAIRFFSNSAGWQIVNRTVVSATQSGANVTLVVTPNVGSASEQWTDVTVLNTWETDASAGQTIAGTNNTASGLFDTVSGGIGNSATGGYGVVCGGNDNRATASQAVVVGGAANLANQQYGAVVGGLDNTAGERAFIGGGANNASSGQFSVIGGGRENVNSGNNIYGMVLGGLGNSTAGDYSAIIGGARGKTNKFGEIAHSSGRFVNSGDAQHCMLVARRTTSDATANQPLFLNGTDLRIAIPAQTMWSFSIKLAAYSVTDNQGAWWFFRGGIRRNNAGSTALVGSVTVDSGAEVTLISASASVVADDTNEALEIRVTGVAGKTIRWVASIDLSQVSAGAV